MSKILQTLSKRDSFCLHFCFHIFMAFLALKLIYTINTWFSFVSGLFFEQDRLLNHGVMLLNRSNNSVFLYSKIYWNRQVFDLIHASGIWMKPEALRHQASSSKISNSVFKSINMGLDHNYLWLVSVYFPVELQKR